MNDIILKRIPGPCNGVTAYLGENKLDRWRDIQYQVRRDFIKPGKLGWRIKRRIYDKQADVSIPKIWSELAVTRTLDQARNAINRDVFCSVYAHMSVGDFTN